MKEQEKPLPQGQIREHDTFFGEKITKQANEKVFAQRNERKPNIWLNCLLMVAPSCCAITVTFLPVALVLVPYLLVVIPVTMIALINWMTSTTSTAKQVWRSIFIGCFASCIYLGVLASQW